MRAAEIHLRPLAEYANRMGAEFPFELFEAIADPHENAIQREFALLKRWLEHWHDIDLEVQDALAKHAGAEDSQAFYAGMVEKALLFAIGWLHSNFDVGDQVKAVRRAMGVA